MSIRSYMSKDENRVLQLADPIAQAGIEIGIKHRRIHQGDYQTFNTRHFSLAAAARTGIRSQVNPVTDLQTAHIRLRVHAGNVIQGPFQLTIFEDTTFDGTFEDGFGRNHDRTSNNNLGLVFSRTGLGAGTQIFDTIVPQGQPWESDWWIIDYGQMDGYLLCRLTNLGAAAANVWMALDWYPRTDV